MDIASPNKMGCKKVEITPVRLASINVVPVPPDTEGRNVLILIFEYFSSIPRTDAKQNEMNSAVIIFIICLEFCGY